MIKSKLLSLFLLSSPLDNMERNPEESPNKRVKRAKLSPRVEELAVIKIKVGDDENNTIEVLTDPMNNCYEYNIGNSLWGASYELIEHIKGLKKTNFKGNTIVEIGAGAGAVGMYLWALGAEVTLTDIEYTLPFMNKNVEHNLKQRTSDKRATNGLEASCIDWMKHETAKAIREAKGKPFDLIVGAEVSYDSDLHEDLLETILILMGPSEKDAQEIRDRKPDPAAIVLLAVPQRDDDEDIVSRAKERGFATRLCHIYPASPEHSSSIAIYELKPPQQKVAIGNIFDSIKATV